jgi:hypothetical protein
VPKSAVQVRGHRRELKSGKTLTIRPHQRLVEKEFAPGIPDRDRFVPLPEVGTPAVWSVAVQRHFAKRRGEHLDLRVVKGKDAFSWAIPFWPKPGTNTHAIEQPTHTADYAEWEGEIPEGYGAGKVKIDRKGAIIVHESGPDAIKFSIINAKRSEDLALIRHRDKVWRLVNFTPKVEAISDQQNKPKYRERSAGQLDPNNDAKVWVAKIDGAHGVMVLQPNKRLRVFSHRKPKKGDYIEWTHKIPGVFSNKGTAGFGDTVLRVEVFARAGAAPVAVERISGMLNASILKSRQRQEDDRTPLKVALIDVSRWKGEDKSKATGAEKIEILRAVAKRYPFLELPEMARTTHEKQSLLNEITKGRHRQTREGVVEIDLHGGRFTKGVIRGGEDIYLRGTYAAKKGKFEGNAVGGFLYSRTPDGPIIGRVGTGLGDKLRREAFRDPSRYKGAKATILGRRYTSGSGRGVSFQRFHSDWLANDDPGPSKIEKAAFVQTPARDASGHWLEKLAEIKRTLRLDPHLLRAVEDLLGNKGTIVYGYGTGTGKTPISVAGIEVMRHLGKASKSLIVVPTGLRTNFAKGGIEKFTTSSYQVIGNQEESRKSDAYVYPDQLSPDKDYTVVGYEMFLSDPVGLMQRTGADTLVFDEFHKLRNPEGATHQAALQARAMAKNFIGLTGSIASNDPSDIAPLLQIATNGGFMSREEFQQRYKQQIGVRKGFFGDRKKIYALKNLQDLQMRAGPVLSYLDTEDLAGDKLPKRQVHEIDVAMSSQQKDIYNFALDEAGPLTAWKIRRNLPLDDRESAKMHNALAQARKASNSLSPFVRGMTLEQSAEQTPKVKRLLDDAQAHLEKMPDAKVVLYSNLIDGGIDVLAAGLRARGIDHGVFVGKDNEIGGDKVTSESRDQDVEDYKAGKKRVLVVSRAGAEGLNLKNSTGFFALDGHFNPEVIRQAEARVRRLGGLKHRDPENRLVEIRRYRSTLPKPGFWARMFGGSEKEFSTDEWIYSTAKKKHVLNRMMRNAVKVVSGVDVSKDTPLPNIPIPWATPAPEPTPEQQANELPTSASTPPPKPAPKAMVPTPRFAMPQPAIKTFPTTMASKSKAAPAIGQVGAGMGGFWRRLSPGHVGHDQSGTPTQGRTWVSAMPKMAGLGPALLAAGGTTAGVAGYDLIRRAMMGGSKLWPKVDDVFRKALVAEGKPARRMVKALDPSLRTITSERALRKEIRPWVREKFPHIPKKDAYRVADDLAADKMDDVLQGNASVMNFGKSPVIVSAKKEHPAVLSHEIGHTRDWKARGIAPGANVNEPQGILGTLFKPTFKKRVMVPEETAWKLAPAAGMGGAFAPQLKDLALKTYEMPFHEGRAKILGLTSLPLLGGGALINSLEKKHRKKDPLA